MARSKQEKELIHEVMLMAYREGIEEGMKRAINVMEQVRGDYSHHPSKNIYASRPLAFDRISYFVEDVPQVCGNCVHWITTQEFTDDGKCEIVDEPCIAGTVCYVERDNDR